MFKSISLVLSVLFACALCAFAIGCAGGTSGTGGVSLEGRVARLNGNPIANATVALVSDDGSENFAVSTDGNGNFVTTISPEKSYSVTIDDGNSSSMTTLPSNITTAGNVIAADFVVSDGGRVDVTVTVRPVEPQATSVPTSSGGQPTIAPGVSPTQTPSFPVETPEVPSTPLPQPTATQTSVPAQPQFPSSLRLQDVQGSVYAQDGFLDAIDFDTFVNESEANTFSSTYRYVHRFTAIDSIGRAVNVAVVALDALDDGSNYEVLFGIALQNPNTGNWTNPSSLTYGPAFSVRFDKDSGRAIAASGYSNEPRSSFNLSISGASVSFTLDLRNVNFSS